MPAVCARAETEAFLSLKQKQQFLGSAVFVLLVCTRRDSNITCSVHLSDIFARSYKNITKGLRVPGLKIEKPAQGRYFYFKCTRRDSNITCSVHLSDIFARSYKNITKGLRVPGLK